MTSQKKTQSEQIRQLVESYTQKQPLECLVKNAKAMLEIISVFPSYKTKKAEYLNIPCSFDIETTSFYEGDSKRATMYVWQFGMGGVVIMGRTWKKFIETMEFISKELGLNESRRLVCYIHNQSFEFQWMRKWFEWVEVFSLASREPVKALCTLGIEFRCSYVLSGYSLARLGEGLNKYKIKKLNGDLDYAKPRNSKTRLTKNELCYCINDVRVVMAYIQEQIDRYGNITRLQLTKTGYVRKYCRDACMYDGSHKHKTWKALEYRKLMQRLTITPEEYGMIKRSFQGGFTHANAYHSGQVCYNVESQDFTSSYPYTMVSRQYPMSKGEKITINTMDEFKQSIKLYCCIFDIRFHGLCINEGMPDCPISASKCYGIKGEMVENNGRVAYCDECITTITEVDFSIYEKFYHWDYFEIGTFYRYRRGYLPTDLVKAILFLYKQKTLLKNVPNREEDYSLYKELVNSVFGCCSMDICRKSVDYVNGEWVEIPPDIDDLIDKYNKDPKRVLSFAWSTYITAWSRYNLFSAIYSLGDDYIYSDTDSVKYMHPERHKEFFDAYNKSVIMRLEKACKWHKIPFDMVSPKTVKGEEKTLGLFDNEGMYKRFLTIGAKRYMVEKPKALKIKNPDGSETVYDISITVSGVNKTHAVPYLLNKYKDPFKAFDNGLVIPDDATGKLTHTYLDDEFSCLLVDYNGLACYVHELSGVHMEGCEYRMSMSNAYIDYLLGIQEKNK